MHNQIGHAVPPRLARALRPAPRHAWKSGAACTPDPPGHAAARSAAHGAGVVCEAGRQGRIALRSAAPGGAGLRPIELYALHQILDVLYALPLFDIVGIRLLRAMDQRLVRHVPSIVQL